MLREMMTASIVLFLCVVGWSGWAGAESRAAATGTVVTLPGPGRLYNDRQAGFFRLSVLVPVVCIRDPPVPSGTTGPPTGPASI